MLRILTIFPEAENIHLVKDVGALPLALHRYCGHEATLACFKNGDYPYAETEAKGLRIVFIPRVFKNTFLDVLWFLWRNRKRYDVAQTYHYRFRSIFWLAFFKLLSQKHIGYLKLDVNLAVLDYAKKSKMRFINARLLRKLDLVSAESLFFTQRLEALWKRTLLCIPNGFSRPQNELVPFSEKENIMLTVARIGAPEKRHDLLLAAFSRFAEKNENWRLQFTGPVNTDFKIFADDFIKSRPHLHKRVVFTGAVDDRKQLFSVYARAKIFCLTSDWEGFPLALTEAAAAGCFLIATELPASADITNNGAFGKTFPAGDEDALLQQMLSAANDEALLARVCTEIQTFALAQFSWPAIAQKLNEPLKQLAR